MSLIIRSDFNGVTDPDAGAYIAAVEAADGQPLEFAVGKAINDFVVGCKRDGIWNAIKASCILAGARTLNGALVPLAGTAPTNFNFGDDDYNRKTGLLGDGSTKYLNSNRKNNQDPAQSKHLAVYMTLHHDRTVVRGALATDTYNIGSPNPGAGAQLLTTTTARTYRINAGFIANNDALISDTATEPGFWGASRNSFSFVEGRYRGTTVNYALQAAGTLLAEDIKVFTRNQNYSNGRFAFYSIGESLNLALLDARVTLLLAGIQVGIDGYDPDAQAYISAVETADGQPLEFSVKTAINQFVTGCKADGIWNAIKASCILAGARTLSGALVPLAGTAPNRFGTEAGWNYNRKTGLQGNGTDNYLNSNRNNNVDPQDNRHLAAQVNLTSSGVQLLAGGRSAGTGVGATFVGWSGTQPQFRCVPNTDTQQLSGLASVGTATLFGFSRNSSSNYTARVSKSSASISSTSTTPNNINLFLFAQNNQGAASSFSNARLTFYSIGESLDLALLDARVTALINAFGAAIP